MYIILSNSDPLPLYEQIKKQITEQIVNGKLLPEDPLPSIRALAKELEISVITVKKAYDDLEAEGFIVTRQGKGSVVAQAGAAFVREAKLKAMQDRLEEAIAKGRELSMSDEDILRTLELLLKEL
ncbi:GntR family transcriptional regulator [Gorillibacterium timonense]|uniref:GntR family transcriptional regulator n=1 Tax=Gorillibacterium timonense TaxID=1689269 RepID=UPI00071E328F|nr:GntR family transcriptional regulator [Gorillibacterium timonense]